MILSAMGAAAGLLGGFAATGLMKSLLHGVESSDPITHAAVCSSIVFAALLATWLPARRAASVDPLEALRAE
jgi:ABC-type lipoprotein release transport system permease subunit